MKAIKMDELQIKIKTQEETIVSLKHELEELSKSLGSYKRRTYELESRMDDVEEYFKVLK